MELLELIAKIEYIEQRVRTLEEWKAETIRRIRQRTMFQEAAEVDLHKLINDIDPLGQG